MTPLHQSSHDRTRRGGGSMNDHLFAVLIIVLSIVCGGGVMFAINFWS